MATQQTSDEPVNQVSTTTTTKRKPGKVVKYILNHKLAFSLLFALIVVFIWAQWQIHKLEKEKQALTETYKMQTDSLRQADYMLVSKVFSWAVRSDMMRNNYDQANQYIDFIIREPHILKAFAIDAATHTIVLSSDKNEVGLPVADITLLRPVENAMVRSDSTVRFVTPITALNQKAGVSVLVTNLK